MADKTFDKKSITLDLAKKMLDAAEVKAREMGKAFNIAVCDEAGTLKAFSGMDEAPLLSLQIAQDKAYTAISFGIASHEWWEMIKDDPVLLHGLPKQDRLIIFGGGYPIMLEGQMIGGIGVSGATYGEDMEVAQAALAVVG